MSESDFYLAFSVNPQVGPKTFAKLLVAFQTAEKAWNADEKEIKDAGYTENFFQKFDTFRKSFDIENYKIQLQKKQVTFIPQNNPSYPKALKKLEDPPIGIYAKGNFSQFQNNTYSPSPQSSPLQREEVKEKSPLHPRERGIITLGVVGTRKITSYGKIVTEKIVTELVKAGFTIISGLALGIDACAHTTTLECQGRTLAVLGCGVDCCYPRENEKLYEEIVNHDGIIISEYPLGQMANKGTFPARNRIIAALSDALLVTEASADSGSLITASYAHKLGKKVFAVPGPITSQQSAGTTELLKNGAIFTTSADDIFKTLQVSPTSQKTINIDELPLSSEEKQILKLLMDEKYNLDTLSKKLKMPVLQLSILISSLELKGYVTNDGGGLFCLSHVKG